MSARVKANPDKKTAGNTEWNPAETSEMRTVVDNEGYEYHLGPNQTMSFLDTGRGKSVIAHSGSDPIVKDESVCNNGES